MRRWVLMALWGLLALCPGCIDIYGHRVVSIRVEDAETRAPIPNAVIERNYSACERHWNTPGNQVFITDTKGNVNEEVVPIYKHYWYVNAKDYVPIQIPCVNEFSSVVTFYLYRRPYPVFQIRVAPDFRGPLFVEIINDPWESSRPPIGQRVFVSAATTTNFVALHVPAIFHDKQYDIGEWLDIQLVSNIDGQPLNLNIADRFECDGSSDSRQVLFVGSLVECKDWKTRPDVEYNIRNLFDAAKSATRD